MKLSASKQSCACLSANLEKFRVNVSNIQENADITGCTSFSKMWYPIIEDILIGERQEGVRN